jgi:glycine cleavage system aminomethyltransferase T
MVTSAVHSPDMGSNIGFAMLAIEACETGTSISVETPEGWRQAEVCALPFPKA